MKPEIDPRRRFIVRRNVVFALCAFAVLLGPALELGEIVEPASTVLKAENLAVSGSASVGGQLTVGSCIGCGGGGSIGPGTVNAIPKFSTTTNVGNSAMIDNGTTVSSSEPIAVTGLISATTSITASTFLQGNAGVYSGSTSDTYMHSGYFGCLYGTNAAATCKVNSVGYQEGTTQNRSLEIDDGKGNAIVTFDGPTKHTITAGTAPTLSSCGTSPTVVGTDMAGSITLGTGATTCTLTFAVAYTTAPTCIVQNRQGSDNIGSYVVSTTAIVYTPPTGFGVTDYICIGH